MFTLSASGGPHSRRDFLRIGSLALGGPTLSSLFASQARATDEFGFRAVEKRVHVHDLHATMLHLMGIDHERLTFRYSGRDYRLTDVHGTVVHDLIA